MSNRREKTAWALFDWASQPFHTIVVTFVFVPLYFTPHFFENGADAQIAVANMNTWAGLSVALCAPIFAAISDEGGRRKLWILVLSVMFILASFGLMSASLTRVMMFYVLAYYAIEMLLIFTNAYLPEITSEKDVGRLSGIAWGLGYLGGIVVLILYLVVIYPISDGQNLLGFAAPLPDNWGPASAVISALWFLVFMIPFFLYMPETQRRQKAKVSTLELVNKSLKNLGHSLKLLWNKPRLFWFFFSSMIYRDAMMGLFTFGTLYAVSVLEWGQYQLLAYGVAVNITGIIGGVLGGLFDQKYGAIRVVRYSVWGFLVITIIALSTNQTHLVFIPVEQGSLLPHIVFGICGLFLGVFAGALQGASRGMVPEVVKGQMENGEAFGIYGMMGRATAFLAPALILFATSLTHSVQYGAWPLIVLFMISIWAFRRFEKL